MALSTTQKELIEKMNINRKAINKIEDEDELLSEQLLLSIADVESCQDILSTLLDSTTKMYVADRLRVLRGDYRK